MALPGENVFTAISILRDIFGDLHTETYDPKNEFQIGAILLSGRVQDGYQSVCLNVENITQDQLDEFNRRKGEVKGNSPIIEERENNITTVGWF